jgi:excisionase family DNA binding protein
MIDLRDRLALRPKEAAKALGISERTLRQMLPELPHVRAGGTILLPVDGLREWLKNQSKAEQGRIDSVVNEVLDSMGANDMDIP